jgi:ethanolamine utilization protein EutQ (cupin superfamily)
VLSDFLKVAIKYELELTSGQFVATGGATDCIFIPKGRKINIVFEKIGFFSVFYK